MIEKRIKVLLIEDNEADLALLKRQILKAAPKSVFTTISHKKDLIEKSEWLMSDIVVSDYHLSLDFTGLDALLYLRSKFESLPFIMASGAINNDEKVAEIIMKGADAFLSKDHLKRLPEIFERIFLKSEGRIAEQNRLLEIENEKKLLFQKIKNLIESAENLSEKESLLSTCSKLEGLIFNAD